MEVMGKNRMIIIKCIEKIDWIITEDYLVLARGPNISRAELNRDHHQTVPMDCLLRQLVVSTKTKNLNHKCGNMLGLQCHKTRPAKMCSSVMHFYSDFVKHA